MLTFREVTLYKNSQSQKNNCRSKFFYLPLCNFYLIQNIPVYKTNKILSALGTMYHVRKEKKIPDSIRKKEGK